MKNKKKTEEERMISFLGKKFKLPQFDEDVIDTENFSKVNIRNYETEMAELPSRLQIFGILVAKALKKKQVAETNYKVWQAVRDKELRDRYEKKNIKFTESKLEKIIRSDPQYTEMKNKIHTCEYNYEVMKAIYWSIQKKADVLTEIGLQRGSLTKLDKVRNDSTDKY